MEYKEKEEVRNIINHKYSDNKIIKFSFILLILVISLCGIATAKTYVFDEPNLLTKIDVCEGPMKIRISPYYKIQEGELQILGCTKLSNYAWSCECRSGKEISFIVSSNFTNIYNFNILYYLEYDEIEKPDWSGNVTYLPSADEIQLDTYLRSIELKGIMFSKPKKLFDFSINITASSIILAAVIIVLGIIIFLFKRYQKKLSKDEGIDMSKDVFNYSTSDTDEAFNKMLEKKQKELEDAEDKEY